MFNRTIGRIILAGIILFAGPALADPHPAGLQEHPFNGPIAPVTEDGVTTFHIVDQGCSDVDYGDGRGESDCVNGNVRSTLGNGFTERLGEAVEYRFDVWVDPEFDYQGWYDTNSLPFLPRGWNSRLRIASWEGQYLHNFLYLLKVDARRGAMFLGETCFTPHQFGEWHNFSMKVLWRRDDRGWIKVTCDDEIIYLAEQVATNQPPHCYITNVCDSSEFKDPDRFNFVLGPVMAGWGHSWQDIGKPSPFTPIQEDGITIRMRNVAVTPGAELYGPEDREAVRALQQHLADLGCDPGPVDGYVGSRTEQAALNCRELSGEAVPTSLGFASVRTFLELYQDQYPT